METRASGLVETMSSHASPEDYLTGAVVRGVRQPDAETVVLRTFRADTGEMEWLISVQEVCPRLVRTFRAVKNPTRPPVFCQWLRTRLIDARLGTPALEPPLVLMIPAERGGETLVLALEFNGADSNLLLLDGERRLLIALRHPSLPGRKLSPGDPYQPPQRGRQPPAAVPADSWRWAPDESRARELDAAGRELEDSAALAGLKRACLQAARTATKRLQRRIENLRADLARAEDAGRLRHWADLLNIHRHRVAPGLRELTVPDDFAAARPDLTIPLDPNLSAAENIERLYRRWRKLTDAVPHVTKRLAEAETQETALKSAPDEIESAPGPAALERLFRAWHVRLPEPRAEARPREEQGAGAEGPVLTRISSDGYTILVGRSKEANDRVTFRLGNGRDWWFHAQGIPGSHVIVRNPSGEALPPATLREAAWLAGYYSSRRKEGKLDVDYVRRKHVRKIKGAEPGQVTYSQNKTVLVDLEDSRTAAILGETAGTAD